MSQDIAVGAQIGGYRIESLLGRGGMGVVYLAHHERLDRKVALKVLAPELVQDEEFRERFVRESRLAASLDHPNVIPLYDADEVDGLLYIAMRYVEGPDLKHIVTSSGPLELQRVVRIVKQIAGALGAAHERGLVHRDVKPANVLVSNADGKGTEHVYLTDFGLTKHRSSQSGYTATGAFVGTIDYIAPEQIEGKKVDSRTDIYSLGCILYECLTGVRPFIKDAEVAVMYAHLMDPRPQVTALRADVPKALDDVVARAMARDVEERFETADELASALDEAVGMGAPSVVAGHSTTSTVTVPPVVEAEPEPVEHVAVPKPARGGPSRKRGVLIGGAVIVVLAAAAFAVMSLGGKEEPAEKTGGDGAAAAAPDPYAYIWVEDRGFERVVIEEGATPESLRDLFPEVGKGIEDQWMKLSPDGGWYLMETERVGCQDHACLAEAPIDSTEVAPVQVGPELVHTYGSGAISSDGNTIVYTSDQGPHKADLWAITRARIGWEDKRLLTEDSGWDLNEYPTFSPDGTEVLFDCHDRRYDTIGGAICEVSINGGELVEVINSEDGPRTTNDSYVRHATYAPDGSIVFEAYWQRHVQVWRLPEEGEPELINPTYEEDYAPCVLTDGRVASLYQGTSLKVMSPDGLDVETIDLSIDTDKQYLGNNLSCA